MLRCCFVLMFGILLKIFIIKTNTNIRWVFILPFQLLCISDGKSIEFSFEYAYFDIFGTNDWNWLIIVHPNGYLCHTSLCIWLNVWLLYFGKCCLIVVFIPPICTVLIDLQKAFGQTLHRQTLRQLFAQTFAHVSQNTCNKMSVNGGRASFRQK